MYTIVIIACFINREHIIHVNGIIDLSIKLRCFFQRAPYNHTHVPPVTGTHSHAHVHEAQEDEHVHTPDLHHSHQH